MKWCAPLHHIFKEIKRHGRHLCIMRIEKNRHPVIIVYYGLVVVPLSCSFRNGMASWVSFHHIYEEMKRNGKHIPIIRLKMVGIIPYLLLRIGGGSFIILNGKCNGMVGGLPFFNGNDGGMHTIAFHFSTDMMEGCPPFHCISKFTE